MVSGGRFSGDFSNGFRVITRRGTGEVEVGASQFGFVAVRLIWCHCEERKGKEEERRKQ